VSSIYHEFLGEWGKKYDWDGARTRPLQLDENNTINESWLIGKAEGAENFAVRFYQVQPHCSTKREKHDHDHGLVFLQGKGNVEVDTSVYAVKQGDVLYIKSNDLHVIQNTGEDVLGFLCIIPAKRIKNGQMVWSEENLFVDK
jgi:quercetin dioxygenase-like cupin family protein